MKTRLFGGTGRAVGDVGLGTWQLGADWGNVSDETAMATLHAAYEAGTTLFDTADVYGMGRSETLIGQFLKETRADLLRDKARPFQPAGLAAQLCARGDSPAYGGIAAPARCRCARFHTVALRAVRRAETR